MTTPETNPSTQAGKQEKMFVISQSQIDDFFAMSDYSAKQLLESLPELSGVPVAFAQFIDKGNIRLWSQDPEQQVVAPPIVPLYRTPQPAPTQAQQPITADDVSDAAYKEYSRLCCADNLTEKEFIAEVVNAVLKHRSTK